MFGIEIDDSVVMQQSQVLEKALSNNPKTQEIYLLIHPRYFHSNAVQLSCLPDGQVFQVIKGYFADELSHQRGEQRHDHAVV